MKPIIKFSKNWNNKLNNSLFTTIRGYDKEKLAYYQRCIDKAFDVYLDGIKYTQARLKIVSLYPFSAIPNILLAIDTGTVNHLENIAIFRKFGMVDPNAEMIILLFKKV